MGSGPIDAVGGEKVNFGRDLEWGIVTDLSGMDTDHAPFNGDLPPPTDHPDFPQWLCRAFGAHLKQLRDDLNRTAMGLAREKKGLLSDQTILNNEGGRLNPGFVTLARHCQMLGTSLPEALVQLIHEIWPPEG
jgi:hypothetical protein